MLLFRRIELMITESLRLLSRHRPVRVRPTTESCLKHHNSSHFIFLVPAITVFSLWNTAAWHWLTLETMAGRNRTMRDDWKEQWWFSHACALSGNSPHPLQFLNQKFPPHFVASSCFFCTLLVLPPLITLPARVDFSVSCRLYHFSLLSTHPHARSLHSHHRRPDRHSNSPSAAASKWFHPPLPLSSPANNAPRSIVLWCRLPEPAVVCWEWRRQNNVRGV